MTLTQITIFFLGILLVIVIAMLVHSYLDKKGIKKSLTRLVAQMPGDVLQESRFHYPRFSTVRGGRQFDLFFNVVKAGRQHILYLVYSMTASLPYPLLLTRKETFKPIANEADFVEANGALLSEVNLPFQARSKHPEWAQKVLYQTDVHELMTALDAFSSLQLGPDALVVGKPYEGPSDTDPEKIIHYAKTLEKLAEIMEQWGAGAPCQQAAPVGRGEVSCNL